MWAIHDLVTGAWNGAPAETDVHDPATQGAVAIPIGWPALYLWSAALPGFVPVVATALSRIAYQRLFTQAERIAIRASTNPIVIDFRELAALAETIALDDPDVVAGTGYLEMLGLIGTGRAIDILTGQSPT